MTELLAFRIKVTSCKATLIKSPKAFLRCARINCLVSSTFQLPLLQYSDLNSGSFQTATRQKIDLPLSGAEMRVAEV